jgi:hypothetical protein
MRLAGSSMRKGSIARTTRGEHPETPRGREEAYDDPAAIEHFRRWMRASMSSPVTPAALRTEITLCGPENLPEMIEVLRDAERECIASLEDLNRWMQSKQRRANTQDQKQHTRAVYAENAARWDERIKWLQDVRLYLKKERQHYETIG